LLLLALNAVLFAGGIALDIALALAAAVAMHEVAGLCTRCGVPPTPWVLYPLGGWLLFRFLLPASVPALEWGLGGAVVAGLLAGLLRRPATDAQAAGVETKAAGAGARAVGAVPGEIPAFFVRWAAAVGGAVYVGLTLGYYLALYRWHPAPDADRFGLRIVCVTLAGSMVGDTAALFAGSRLGRHPFFPRVSPRKTVEGAVGGAVATLVTVTVGMPWLVGLPVWQAGLLGLAVAVAAQGGDLAESALKRAAGAKDSSTLIPGHGGLLDRVDSLLLLGPVVYCFLRVAGLP
ncbi:MAG TPA: phosphatidate cytidylyltransferase, partial [Candidatus Dormibacteraeota bacterium]|nr:phosphatidate cytidylyltransferase [Candidatus Dormibacteraeota bacterium]